VVVSDDFRLGPYLVEPGLNSISRNGTTAHLEPKVMEVLLCLAGHAGETVAKEQLLQTVWPDTFVSDDALKHCVSDLRRVLEDDAREPRFIQTIPKRGYRLVAPVQPVNGIKGLSTPAAQQTISGDAKGTGVRKWWIAAGVVSAAVFLSAGLIGVKASRERLRDASGAPSIHSLAVLPLQSLSADPAQEYFSDGMTDALITDLAQIGSLKVVSRTSSMQYKQSKKSLPEIARELNVDGIIEGTVQRSGDRVRITAQLIHGPTDKDIWADSYERDVRDVFALEREITSDIADQVRARVTTQNQPFSVQPRPLNLDALDAYLQGNYHLNKAEMGPRDEELRKAGEYFQHAIDADPTFVSAYLGLAEAHHNVWWPSGEDFAIMRASAAKALVLAPNSSDAHRVVGLTKFEDWDWAGAQQEYRRAIVLSPNNAAAHELLGDSLDVIGHADEAWKEYEIAQELDPNWDHLSNALHRRGQYDRELELNKRTIESRPEDGVLLWGLSEIYAQKGLYKDWVQAWSKALSVLGFPEMAARIQRAFVISGYPGALRQTARDEERVAAKKQAYMPGMMAETYAELGDKDHAFYWLQQGCEHRHKATSDPVLVWVKAYPGFASLRSDPRFQDVLQCMGLPP
jgi:TolB-like protein/DNA-binding winged helix-turn-helix (wHTH) protein/tetratricopeptide (TPR) repeat protein